MHSVRFFLSLHRSMDSEPRAAHYQSCVRTRSIRDSDPAPRSSVTPAPASSVRTFKDIEKALEFDSRGLGPVVDRMHTQEKSSGPSRCSPRRQRVDGELRSPHPQLTRIQAPSLFSRGRDVEIDMGQEISCLMALFDYALIRSLDK